MPHRKSPPLDARIQCRLTTDEKIEVVEQAGLSGMTLSAYCRRRLLRRPVIADTDMNMIRELRRQGGQLKKIHTDSKGVYSVETAEAIREITTVIRSLAKKAHA